MAANAYEYSFYDTEAKDEFLALSKEGAVSAFIYSDKFIKLGEAHSVTADGKGRVVAYSGEMYAPAEFFLRALDVKVCQTCFPEFKVGGSGEALFPIIKVCEWAGLCAKSYYEDRLIVIGTAAQLKKIDEDEKIAIAASYVTLGEYDPYSFTSDDYRVAREKWKVCLVGSPEINDLTNPTIKEKIDLISKDGKANLARMNKNADRVILFGENPPVESVELSRQYGGLRRIALAYATYGSELYKNEEARAAVVDGVRWMYENMYGEAEIEGRGWRDAHLFNWYFWYISAGEYLTDIMFVMEEDFPLDIRRKYLRCFDWCSTFMRYWFAREAALSRISVCTKVGLATENPKRLFEENVDFDMLLGLQGEGEGPRIDYAQWSHGMPYNNAYGTLNLDRVLLTASCLSGTPVEFKSPKQYNQFMVVKYMFEAAMYKGRAFRAFMGRDVHYNECNKGGTILGDMLPMIGMFGEDEDRYVKGLIKRCIGDKEVYAGVLSHASIEGCAILNDIKIDGTIPTDTEYEYAHAWYTADRAAQHGKNYAAVIAMSSKRANSPWESINSANKNGWYTGDGAFFLYTDYDKSPYDKENYLMVNDDIAYNFPGTTEDERERVKRSIGYSRNVRAKNSFSGSMQIRDKYIVAGMDFISHSNAGPDDHPDDSGGGGSAPIHLNDLRAKKSWFCLDGEIVCLGAGINSTMNSPVNTTVEHRRILSPESDEQYLGGELLPKGEYKKTHTGDTYFNMKGHAGYVFYGASEIRATRYVHEGAGGQSFMKVQLLHGENPTDKSYCYAVIPGADNELLEQRVKNPDFNVIENSALMQAIECPKLDLKAFVFHAPHDHGGVGASAPCIATLEADRITVCDPTQELEELVITVWRHLNVTKKPKGADIRVYAGRTDITLNMKDSYGKSFVVEFERAETDAFYKVSYFQKDEDEFLKMSKEGVIAAYIYCNKVLKGGERYKYNDADEGERAVAKNGVMMLPVSFFEKFLGKSAPEMERYVSKGREYLPAIMALRSLGLLAKTFYSDRLLVIGSKEQLERISASAQLAEAGAYAVFGKYDASKFTPEDYAAARREWKLRLVGSPEINDLTDEAIRAKISWINTQCERALSIYNSNDDRVILFGDKPPVESEDLGYQYSNLERLANAWGTYGADKYQDGELLKTIISCLEWLYENMYGEAEIEGRGWRSVFTFNWWHWFYGAADSITNIMLIINDHLTDDQRKRFLKCYCWLRTVMYTDKKGGGAASRLTPGAKAAILLESKELLEQAQRDCDTSMSLSEYDGIHKADYLNWTHYCPHNISYGVINLQRALFVASILNSTALSVSGPKRYNQFELVKYSFEPSIYRSQGFVMFSGRSTFSSERSHGLSVLTATLPMIGSFGEDEDNYLKHFIKRNACTPELIKRLKAGASIYECAKLNDLLDDDSVSAEYDYEYAHAWFTGDRAAQHRNNYAIGIAMSSRREKAYECINSANKTGWHTGDGATYLYTEYDGNQYDGDNFITKNINVAYRFPGTTEDSRERVARSIASRWEWYSKNSFAGSMQIDKKYIVAGMDFISLNYEGPEIQPDDYGYGGSQPIQINDLVAKKAWFCLDGEIVCLGAGINSTMSSPVQTIVEHRRVVNRESDEQIIATNGGETLTLPRVENYEKTYTGANWVLMKGHAGYLFPKKCEVLVGGYDWEEANGQRFFEVRVLHGENPCGATYEYVIMPYATEKKLAEAYENPTYKTLSNTETVQAVQDYKTGVAAYVFYEAAECGDIGAKSPCLVSVRKDGGETVLSVSDPTHCQDSVTLTVKGKIKVVGTEGDVTVTEKDGVSLITFDVFGAHGRRFEVKYVLE